jgi:hypothetical protein
MRLRSVGVLFPTDLDATASRLNPVLASSGRCLVGDSLASDVARWLPIVNRAAAANTSKPSLTCANTLCPRHDSNVRPRD